MPTRLCRRCNTEKDLLEFHKAREGKFGRRSTCKACTTLSLRANYWADPKAAQARQKVWRQTHPEEANARNRKYAADHPEWATNQRRKYKLRYSYNLTKEDVQMMKDKQGGLCANGGCSNPATDIDHNHTTGKVREMLCSGCNKTLGLLKEKVGRIYGLADYLLRHEDDECPPSPS